MPKKWFKFFDKGATTPPKTDVRLKNAIRIVKGRKNAIDKQIKKATGN